MSSDLRISGASPNSRSESDIRVNYQDTSKIVAASNDLTASTQPQFFSIDGGATWGQSSLSLVGSDVFAVSVEGGSNQPARRPAGFL